MKWNDYGVEESGGGGFVGDLAKDTHCFCSRHFLCFLGHYCDGTFGFSFHQTFYLVNGHL